MATNNWEGPGDPPRWDEALAALVQHEFDRLGEPLNKHHFEDLGKANGIRFHDLMETMYQLTRHGAWRAFGNDCKPLSDASLDALYPHGRLDEKVAEKLAVTWAPKG